jgi:hypothetical protein
MHYGSDETSFGRRDVNCFGISRASTRFATQLCRTLSASLRFLTASGFN